GLLDGLERHGEAIEHDLVAHGWTIDDIPHRLNWRAFRSFVRHSARRPGSAIARVAVPDHADWDLQAHLLAGIFDLLNVANWQRGARKGTPRPKPLPRPEAAPDVVHKGDAVPISQVRKTLGRLNPAAWSSPAT